MDLQLKGKHALVTGSSRGLGYAAALVLAKEGCNVAVNSRDETKVSAAARKISTETGAICSVWPAMWRTRLCPNGWSTRPPGCWEGWIF